MKHYKVIVVDPPWSIRKTGVRSSRPNQGTTLSYNTMSLADIANLPINKLADQESSICFLWTIQKMLPQSFSIMIRWGFNYKLTMTWDKGNGIVLGGFHYRSEFIIVGTIGKWNTFMEKPACPSVFQAKSLYHSAKPDYFYILAENFGEPRIDMFARKKRGGWDSWGDEVESDIELKDYSQE